MRKLFSTLLFFSLTHFVYAETTKVETPKVEIPQKEKILAEMSMTDTTGKTYKVTGISEGLKIEGLEDKIVFLEFFGYQCPPCLASIPHLINLQKKTWRQIGYCSH